MIKVCVWKVILDKACSELLESGVCLKIHLRIWKRTVYGRAFSNTFGDDLKNRKEEKIICIRSS